MGGARAGAIRSSYTMEYLVFFWVPFTKLQREIQRRFRNPFPSVAMLEFHIPTALYCFATECTIAKTSQEDESATYLNSPAQLRLRDTI